EPELPRPTEERRHQPPDLALEILEPSQDLVADEGLGRLRVEQVLLGEVGAGELRARAERLDEPDASHGGRHRLRRPDLVDDVEWTDGCFREHALAEPRGVDPERLADVLER